MTANSNLLGQKWLWENLDKIGVLLIIEGHEKLCSSLFDNMLGVFCFIWKEHRLAISQRPPVLTPALLMEVTQEWKWLHLQCLWGHLGPIVHTVGLSTIAVATGFSGFPRNGCTQR